MKIGTFDILGPNMIGPSSSHTAGALRIAFIAGKMVGRVKKSARSSCTALLPAPTMDMVRDRGAGGRYFRIPSGR